LHIHIAPEGRAPMQTLDTAQLTAGQGIECDRYATGRGYYSQFLDIRDVPLIKEETLIALVSDHGITLNPDEHRRNLTTRAVPLNHFVGRRFRVGGALLERGCLNTSCFFLDLVTRKSVCDVLEHRTGLNCRIIESGQIRPGDPITPLP
jgi:MOSC domain-containing protein YiiM